MDKTNKRPEGKSDQDDRHQTKEDARTDEATDDQKTIIIDLASI